MLNWIKNVIYFGQLANETHKKCISDRRLLQSACEQGDRLVLIMERPYGQQASVSKPSLLCAFKSITTVYVLATWPARGISPNLSPGIAGSRTSHSAGPRLDGCQMDWTPLIGSRENLKFEDSKV